MPSPARLLMRPFSKPCMVSSSSLLSKGGWSTCRKMYRNIWAFPWWVWASIWCHFINTNVTFYSWIGKSLHSILRSTCFKETPYTTWWNVRTLILLSPSWRDTMKNRHHQVIEEKWTPCPPERFVYMPNTDIYVVHILRVYNNARNPTMDPKMTQDSTFR